MFRFLQVVDVIFKCDLLVQSCYNSLVLFIFTVKFLQISKPLSRAASCPVEKNNCLLRSGSGLGTRPVSAPLCDVSRNKVMAHHS